MFNNEKNRNFAALSNEELVLLIKNGSDKAFDELGARFRKTVVALSKNYFADALTDEDWFQEGMIGFLLAVRTFRAEKGVAFSTYASVCISNRLRSVCKKALGSTNAPLNESLALEDFLVPHVSSTEEDYIENESYRFFTEKYFSVLSKTEKMVIGYYVAGFSYQEIAKKLNISEKSVDNALCRAKAKIRKAFL